MIDIHQVALQGNIASRKKDGVQKQNHADTNIKRKKDMEAIDKYVILGNGTKMYIYNYSRKTSLTNNYVNYI